GAARRRGAPERYDPLRRRSEGVGARSQLQGARAGQSLCRRRELLSLERRSEPGPHNHGECAPGRRPYPGALAVKLTRLAVLTLALAAPPLRAQQMRSARAVAHAARGAVVAAVGAPRAAWATARAL